MYNLGQLLQDEAARRDLARQIDGRRPAGMLRSIKMKITSGCNLRCRMCKYWRTARQQLSKEVIFDVLQSAASTGCRKVHLSGGEVTLHDELAELIRRGSELGMRVNLTSNGYLMDKQRARQWIHAGLRSASFSLDGVDRKRHDLTRGVRGAFKRTVRAVGILRREIDRRNSRASVRINVVLWRENLKELPGLVRLAGELGAVDVLPMPVDGKLLGRPEPAEIEAFNRDVVPQVHQLRRQFEMPIDSLRLYPFGRTEDQRLQASAGRYALGYYRANLCYAPYLHAFISHTGEVYPCCMARGKTPPLGNVKDRPLADVFRGEAYDRLRRGMLQERLPVCANCDQFLLENRLVCSRLHQELVPLGARPVTETL